MSLFPGTHGCNKDMDPPAQGSAQHSLMAPLRLCPPPLGTLSVLGSASVWLISARLGGGRGGWWASLQSCTAPWPGVGRWLWERWWVVNTPCLRPYRSSGRPHCLLPCRFLRITAGEEFQARMANGRGEHGAKSKGPWGVEMSPHKRVV